MSVIKPNEIVKSFIERSDLVNRQANKAKESSAWIKPVVYTALGAAGVAATSFILYRSFFSSSLDPVDSSSNFTPTPTPTSMGHEKSIDVIFGPTPAPAAKSSIEPLSTLSTIPKLTPTPIELESSIAVTFGPTPAPVNGSSIEPFSTLSTLPKPTPTSMGRESSKGVIFGPTSASVPESSIISTPTSSEISAPRSTSMGDDRSLAVIFGSTPIPINGSSIEPLSTSKDVLIPTLIPTNDEKSMDLIPIPTPLSISASLKPLGKSATWGECQNRGNDLLKYFQYNPENIDLNGIWKRASEGLPVKKDLSAQETRVLYDNCKDQISKFLPRIDNPMDRAVFVISQPYKSGCQIYARNAMKDQFWAQTMMFRDGGVINREEMFKKSLFLYYVGLLGTTNSSETATKFVDYISRYSPPPSNIDWPAIDFIEPWVDSFGKCVGNNPIGHAINQYPLSSPLTSSAVTIVSSAIAISILSSMERSGGFLKWTIPLQALVGYFVPHMVMSPSSLVGGGNGLSSLSATVDEKISEEGKQVG